MADTSGTDKRDPKKAFIWGLKGEVTEDLLRKVMEPAAKSDQIVSVAIVPDKAPEFKGKMMAFVECKDEATAAAIIDLLKGEKMPEITDREVGAALAYDNRKPERTPRPRLTRAEVDEIVAALKADPAVKGKPGKDGVAPTKDEILAALKADPALKGEPGKDAKAADVAALLKADPTIKGKDGKAPTKADVAATLKADDDFKVSVKGANGKDGKDAPKAAWILCLVLATLAFLVVLGHAFCGSSGEQGPQGIHGQIGPRGPQGLEGPAGPKGDPAPVTAVEEAVSAEPAEPTAPEATPAAALVPTTPHAVGAIVVRDRFDRVEVRLDQVEQKLHEHFCDGSGPRDQERCAATR